MKRTKNIILILILLFIIIIISLLILLSKIKGNNKKDNSLNNQINNYIENSNLYPTDTDTKYDESLMNKEVISKELKYENVNTNYFTIKGLVENYVNLAGNRNAEKILELLSDNYITEYGVNSNNILRDIEIQQLTDYRQYYKLTITDMYNAQTGDSLYVYIVKGNCRIVGNDSIFSVQIMLEVDTSNKTYNIYPSRYIKDKGYDKLNIGDKINYSAESIKEGNKFIYINKNENDIIKEYFNNYNELLIYYPDLAYNMLDKNYANKRFKNSNNFKDYIEENKKTLYLMQIEKYKIDNNGIDYICSDQYENIYIFRKQKGVMQYTVFLDNYTIMLDEYSKQYNQLDKFDKSKYNINKFVNMLNTKDYDSAYNCLDNTFRNNNFRDPNSFMEYMKDNLYDLNLLQIESYDDETYDYYVFNCKITNRRNLNESKNITIIINQEEGTNFTMSFSF